MFHDLGAQTHDFGPSLTLDPNPACGCRARKQRPAPACYTRAAEIKAPLLAIPDLSSQLELGIRELRLGPV